jgi:hypothetical protein
MFVRPVTPTVAVTPAPVVGECPECRAPALARYRVLSEGGWWDVVKCRECLASLERTRGPLLGVLSEAVAALIPDSPRAPE